MTNDEFVEIMREKGVNAITLVGGGWKLMVFEPEYNDEFANDPVEAMEALAKRLGWIGGGEE